MSQIVSPTDIPLEVMPSDYETINHMAEIVGNDQNMESKPKNSCKSAPSAYKSLTLVVILVAFVGMATVAIISILSHNETSTNDKSNAELEEDVRSLLEQNKQLRQAIKLINGTLAEMGEQIDDLDKENEQVKEEIRSLSNNMTGEINELTDITNSIQHGPNNCKEKWTAWRDTCYFVGRVMGTFDEAKADCLNREARLAFPRNVDEYMLLKALIPGNSDSSARGLWLDITLNNGKWTDGDNNDVSDQIESYWHFSQPDVGTENCGCIFQRVGTSYSFFALHDFPCTNNYLTWICFDDK